jgi:hypothetical protein
MKKPNGDLRRFNGGKREGAGRKARGKVRLTVHLKAMTAEFLRERATANKQSISESAEGMLVEAITPCRSIILRRIERSQSSKTLKAVNNNKEL